MGTYSIRLDFSTSPACIDCSILLVSSGNKIFDRTTHRRHAKGGRCTPCLYKARHEGKEVMPDAPYEPEGQQCKTCGRYETYDKFTRNLGCSSGHSKICKMCTRLHQYRISRDQYEQMLVDQNYMCLICGIHEDEIENDRLHVDHDHSCCKGNSKRICGKCVRGLLCRPCNMALGFLKDSEDALEKALIYVRKKNTNG